jgi:hypothetical protein
VDSRDRIEFYQSIHQIVFPATPQHFHGCVFGHAAFFDFKRTRVSIGYQTFSAFVKTQHAIVFQFEIGLGYRIRAFFDVQSSSTIALFVFSDAFA